MKRRRQRKRTEIDVIASLTPISWRRSLRDVVTEWKSGLEGHQVSELDSLYSAPAAPPRKREGREWTRHYSMLRPVLFNTKWADHAKETSYPYCEQGEKRKDTKHLLLLFHEIKHKIRTTQKNSRSDKESNLTLKQGDWWSFYKQSGNYNKVHRQKELLLPGGGGIFLSFGMSKTNGLRAKRMFAANLDRFHNTWSWRNKRKYVKVGIFVCKEQIIN
jgi:hypothetical protein